MSIANEITRIKNAKSTIKDAVVKRGVSLGSSALIDTYGAKLESAPYAVRGYFTPEADTSVFSVSGLPFRPKTAYIVCNELQNITISNTIIVFVNGDGLRGVSLFWGNNETRKTTSFSEDTTLTTWTQGGFSLNVQMASSEFGSAVFKAGYTYEYYITGGFSQ